MPIGKDSITKRVAKQTEPAKEEKIAPELVATTAAAPATTKAPAKKATSASTAKKTTTTTKKPAAPKAAAPKVEAPKAEATEAPVVETAVLANVSPETVAAVIGHKEDEKYEKVQIGQKMPDFLL
jgi:hypothetical protein